MRELRYIEVSTARRIRNGARRSLHEPAARAGLRLRRAPALPAGRRRAAHRLERHRAARRAVRAADARRARAEHGGRHRRLALDGARDLASLEARGDDAHQRVARVLGAREPDQHRLPRVFRQGALSRPPRRTRAAAWAILEQCWSATAGSGRTAARADGPASLENAEADEHRVPRVRLPDRRRPLRRARPGDAGGAPRRHRGRSGGSRRARAPRRAGVRAACAISNPAAARPSAWGRDRGSGTRPRRAGIASRSRTRSTAFPWSTCSSRPTDIRSNRSCRSSPRGAGDDPPSPRLRARFGGQVASADRSTDKSADKSA